MESLYSSSWHQVAPLRPRLSTSAAFHRHVYRGEDWYVIRNPVTGQVNRLTPTAYALVSRMDGEQTTQQIWDAALTRLGDDAPTQDETLSLMAQLYMADVLCCDVPPDTAEVFRRVQKREERERSGKLNPISFRIPLFDPDAFLERWLPFVSPLFTRAGLVAWCFVVGWAALNAAEHGPEIQAGARRLFEPESLMALWFTYPVVKSLHELGHAFAVKRWGGEVHEIGVLFLVFMPVPYVDASAASLFPQKERRMAVAGAGIAVELFLAALASWVWLSVEPGGVAHVAYAVMLVGGVSTLLFNGNPLLRFDGYYVLADWLEIPNLAARSNQLLGNMAKRRLLGLRDLPCPETTPRETAWLVGYGITSFFYRIGVLLGIALYLATEFFFVGVVLALATILLRVVVPLVRQLAYVLTDPTIGERRGRALVGSLGLTALVTLALVTVPMPLRTQAEGIVWLPEEAHVRARGDGFIEAQLVASNTLVERGQPLIRTRDPSLETEVSTLEARVRELRLRFLSIDTLERVESDGARARLQHAEAELARARERASNVLVRSPTAGRFVVVDGRDPVGRFVRQGEVVGYVVDPAKATARVVVPQEEAAALRERSTAAWVRLEHALEIVLPAELIREVPAATNQLPTPALGTAAGGPVAVDPSDPNGLKTQERVFQFDLALPPDAETPVVGERVYARFDRPAEPVAQRLWRSWRNLFLDEFGV